ncbi:adenylate/guanylate cyclase domain-containing protein [Ruficoccus amylovorans]|uniref:Adenylate/guanylate cyclase domain-containing protein n=1 Tax=Ruficoccus amylovorans TaxID=1804625 RepID=A0A842HDC5_9BACT|nr:adenylate/guanylate cyclase domain-containing protein [Ruficoccus amylovorans]MBC2594513.1 adenylate/guanylate cyclase domain-containing protein [Ruficoccus amylovorans]
MQAGQAVTRHYPIPRIDFADFWDICGTFMRIHPGLTRIRYTIEGSESTLADHEYDVARILDRLHRQPQDLLLMEAEFEGPNTREGHARAVYRPVPVDSDPGGLTISTPSLSKLLLYQFESLLYDKYDLEEQLHPTVKFGKPCEVLASIIDLRGFSQFCEKPTIESPYTCGLMHSFYQAVRHGYIKYPPDLLKFLGDGVLALWETTAEDREVAIETCLSGSLDIHNRWQVVRRSPQFTHGAPEEVAVGISFGLASRLPEVGDYIGRPVNIASRLSSVCPGGQLYVDKSVPGIGPEYSKDDATAHIKSFGRYYIWRIHAV